MKRLIPAGLMVALIVSALFVFPARTNGQGAGLVSSVLNRLEKNRQTLKTLNKISFPSERKKPRNYRERSSYVNLEAPRTAVGVDYFSNIQNLYLTASRQPLDLLFDFTPICFVTNNFRTQKHGLRVWPLMHRIPRSFATRKPAFWCQKNENQNDYTQKIPLPGVSRVVPEEDLLQCGSQGSHVLTLASRQPLDSWLAGR